MRGIRGPCQRHTGMCALVVLSCGGLGYEAQSRLGAEKDRGAERAEPRLGEARKALLSSCPQEVGRAPPSLKRGAGQRVPCSCSPVCLWPHHGDPRPCACQTKASHCTISTDPELPAHYPLDIPWVIPQGHHSPWASHHHCCLSGLIGQTPGQQRPSTRTWGLSRSSVSVCRQRPPAWPRCVPHAPAPAQGFQIGGVGEGRLPAGPAGGV